MFDFGHVNEHKTSCQASMYLYKVYLVPVKAESFIMLPGDRRFVEIQVIRLYLLNFSSRTYAHSMHYPMLCMFLRFGFHSFIINAIIKIKHYWFISYD